MSGKKAKTLATQNNMPTHKVGQWCREITQKVLRTFDKFFASDAVYLCVGYQNVRY